MDKRKAIVIAVVLFLLIGLGTFVFANPTQRGLEGDNTGNTTQGGSESVDDNTDGKEENSNEEQDEENDEPVISVIDDGNGNTGNGNSGNGNGGSSNNNNGNNNGGSTEEDNSAYLAALAALEKAEASYLQGDLDVANDLISNLADGSDRQGLVDRANALQNVIDVETLVKNLQTKVNEAENIDNMNDARNYRNNEEIINKVTELANSTKKDELTSILNDLNKILDDMTAPGIHGIDNGVVTATDVSLTVDESDVKVYINGEEKSLSDLNFTEEGDYTVKVVDKAFNETTIQFAIDKNAPEFNVASGTHSDTAMNIVVTDNHFASIRVVNQDTGDTKDYTTNEITLEDEATYHIIAYDKAGNYKDIWVAIDNTVPTVNATGTGVDNFFRDEEVTLTAFDKFLTEVKVNDETYGQEDFTYAANNENATFTKVFTEEGTYDVVAKDKFGHETKYTFVIDQTNPVLKGVENGGTYKEATLEIVEENLHTAEIRKENGRWEDFTSGYKVSESGTYYVKIIDKAYNRLEISFTIDADAPEGYNVGILNVTHYRENNSYLDYAKVDDEIRVMVYFKEQLATLPTLVLNGVELENEFFYAEDSSNVANSEYVYMADVKLTQEVIDQIGLTDGIITFTIKGYTDALGNVGKDLTNANILEDATYKEVKFDTTLPQLLNYPESGFTKEDFKIEVNDDVDTIVISKRNSDEESQTVQNGYVLTEEASYIIDITDKAGNKIRYNLGVDKNPPIINGVTDGAYYNHAVSITVDDLQLAGAVWLNNEKYTQGTLIEEEGTYTVTATDRVGNTTTVAFTIDKTPATRDYSTLYFEETGKLSYDIDGNKAYYMKNGDSVIFRIAFHEELKDVPTVTIGGQNVEMTSKGLFQNNDGEDIYVYEGTFKIAEDEATMTEGMLEIKLSNVVDLAGNVATDEAVLNQTPTSNNRVMIYDRTLEDYEIIFHSSNANNTSAKIGDYIGVYFIVNEELKQNPTFTLNGKEYKVNQTEVNGNRYKYAVVVPVTEDFLEGDVTFTITNIVDKAGNQYPDLSNDDVDTTVTIDNTAPIFDLSKIADTFEVGVDTYVYPQPGIVTDNIDGNISFGEVHMQWFKKTADGEKGEETTCFGGDNWNTGLTNCDLGTYIVTYKVYDKAGNEAYAEKEITLQDTTKPGFKPSYFEKTVELNRNGVFTDYPIVEGTDNTNGPVTVEKIGEDVDITKVGDYYIRYKVTDASGNSATNKVFVYVRDTKAPELVVDGLTNGFTTSSNVAIHAVDQSNFKIVVKRDGKVVRDQDPGTLNSNNVFGVWFGLTDTYGDGHFEVIATDEYNNSVTIEFDRIMISLADQDVGSNPINADGSFGIFNSFAVKFNRDLTFTNYSLTNGFKIEMEYSVDGGNTYKKSGTVINNSWTGTLGNSTTSKYEGSTFTVTAGSPIYWNGTSVSTRYKEIYDAILATEGTENEVYVRTVFTVIQPTYTKSFALDPVIYSDGGQTVSPQGLAQF